ncbi:MAG: hypothetical protein JEZ09_18750 [Salinivirgaceae bacterium]|nr:hypothetical protein [Salinivirgaceae bacterium]
MIKHNKHFAKGMKVAERERELCLNNNIFIYMMCENHQKPNWLLMVFLCSLINLSECVAPCLPVRQADSVGKNVSKQLVGWQKSSN